MLHDHTMLISIKRKTIVNCIWVQKWEGFSELIVGGVVWKFFVKDLKTLFGIYLKPKIIDILVLLYRLKGEVKALSFLEQYFFLVQEICLDIQYIDWASEVSKNLSRALSALKFYNMFYMSSFLIYVLASLQFW